MHVTLTLSDSRGKSLLICWFILDIRRAEAHRTGQSTSFSLANLNLSISVEANGPDWVTSFGGPICSTFIDAEGNFDPHAAATTALTDIEGVHAEAAVTGQVVEADGAEGS